MRLDKFLCDMQYGTRSQIKKEIKNGLVTVNGRVIKENDYTVDEDRDEIFYKGNLCTYEKFVYYLLHKPAGFVSATTDPKEQTVLSLLHDTGRKDLFPVGRLDKDTEGLLILTNDGNLAHKLTAPGQHVEKVYEAVLKYSVTDSQLKQLKEGIDIGERRPVKTKYAIADGKKLLLTLTEGKFHQVKRMLHAVGNEVVYLKRIRMGGLFLPENLALGEYQKLTKDDIDLISQKSLSYTDGMFNEIDAAIFDLDGTLVDSMWMWGAIDDEYLGSFGIEKPEHLQAAIEGMSFSETAEYFKETFHIPDSLDKIKEDWNRMAWDKYLHEVPLKCGAANFLKACQGKGIKLGIATSNSRELVENVVSAHGLHTHFDCIMTACEVKRGKPSPDIYLAVAKRMDVEPGRCLVFEDITAGILAGKSAGMKVCAVYDEYSVSQDPEKKKLADYYIHDFEELLEIRQ